MESEWHDHAKCSILMEKMMERCFAHILLLPWVPGPHILQCRIHGALVTAFYSPFEGYPTCSPFFAISNWHLEIQVPGSLEKGHQSAAREVLIQVAKYFSQKLWPKPDSGNFAPCILPCQICNPRNSGKERYLRKPPFLTLFVYRNGPFGMVMFFISN